MVMFQLPVGCRMIMAGRRATSAGGRALSAGGQTGIRAGTERRQADGHAGRQVVSRRALSAGRQVGRHVRNNHVVIRWRAPADSTVRVL